MIGCQTTLGSLDDLFVLFTLGDYGIYYNKSILKIKVDSDAIKWSLKTATLCFNAALGIFWHTLGVSDRCQNIDIGD